MNRRRIAFLSEHASSATRHGGEDAGERNVEVDEIARQREELGDAVDVFTRRAMVLVTHYQRLLDYIVPDYVHVLAGGRIVKSGGPELALELEREGYGWIEKALAGAR